MLDLGTSFVASVARDPKALAVVDGDVRLTYEGWYARISAVVAGFRPDRPAARATISSRFCRTAGKRPPCTGPASSPASSSRRSTGAPRPTRSTTPWRTPKPRRSSSRACRRRGRRQSHAAVDAAAHRRRAADAAPGRSPSPSSSPPTRRSAAPRVDRRGAVADALHLRHHREAEGRAAPPPGRARRCRRPCGAESLRRMASARSASCRSITRWACARCSPCR